MIDTTLEIAVLPGDGIGPEIVDATLEVADAALGARGVAWRAVRAPIGFEALEAHGTTLPQASFDVAARADGVILGPVSHNDYPPAAEGGVNPSGELRKRLDLYANVRPAKTVAGLPGRVDSTIDLVIVRENTEGFYADRTMHAGTGEFMPTPDLALAMRKVTRTGSERIARYALDLARRRRSALTVVHKANVLRISDGLFLEAVRGVAAEYPDVEYEEQLVDAMAALLIRAPERYDVVVTTNMFGDILSDEATELTGSIGLAASLNVGADHAVAQAQHGSAPTLASLDVANPASLVGSTAMLFDWLAERRADERLADAAAAIRLAIEGAAGDPSERTRDLGGTLGTAAFSRAVIARLTQSA